MIETRRMLTTAVRRRPLPAFFLLAFAFTWVLLPWNSFLAGGPLIAAIVVTAVAEGRPGLRALRRTVLNWRIGWHWYAAAILMPLGLAVSTGLATVELGGPGAVVRNIQLSSLAAVFAARLLLPVGAPLGEEPGWRAFALPRLLDQHSPLAATFVLGVIVALWHVPLIWLAGEHLPPVFIPTTVAVTFFYSWLFLRTGSVFVTIIAHAVEGTVAPSFSGSKGFVGTDKTHWTLLYAGGWCVIALALVIGDRSAWKPETERRPSSVKSSKRVILAGH
jgi:membrane protease YdiL (CAAX protease family)